ncbi:hypothetical protein AciX9_3059 [Granulicella tundricola MP5ACTX9]|uniref:Uncharacterized protein n=1 Tax=Granulicella tundricola (strain ATCC BAA-1859 / DSM 23138 / MP5ACTX9) TaxID=1198114 RepID=E8X098_GRATM|nr:hypothetical protein AciX9_3059 [Granulicella tundricola MP5ACTX9]
MDEIIFHPIYSLARNRSSEPGFDLSLLPLSITENVTLEDISPFLSKDSFNTWKRFLGEPEFERLGRIRLRWCDGLIRYQSNL